MKNKTLKDYFESLRLPESIKNFERIADEASKESLSYEEFLTNLLREEVEVKTFKKISRLLNQSCLDLRKTMEAFDKKRLSKRLLGQIENLLRGDFLKRTENVLAFGNPGSGKTHLLSAIAQELIRPCP